MFVGHFAVAFAAKRVTPRLSLAMLFAAALFADILWPILVAAGIEVVRIAPGDTAFTPLEFVSYPYSHSLATLVAWGVAVGATYRAIAGGRRVFPTLAALVVSHWLLDWVTHKPDMPLYPGGPRYGLGLWNSIPATMTIELALFAAGVWIYVRATRPRDAIGRWALISFVTLLTALYFISVASGPPPSITALYVTALAGSMIFCAWGWWADRHRGEAGDPPAGRR